MNAQQDLGIGTFRAVTRNGLPVRQAGGFTDAGEFAALSSPPRPLWRGKDTLTGRWLTGILTRPVCRPPAGRAGQAGRPSPAGSPSPQLAFIGWREVLPATLGMETGVRDGCGKPVFGGDILALQTPGGYECHYAVGWGGGSFLLYEVTARGIDLYNPEPLFLHADGEGGTRLKGLRVAGNIHDDALSDFVREEGDGCCLGNGECDPEADPCNVYKARVEDWK